MKKKIIISCIIILMLLASIAINKTVHASKIEIQNEIQIATENTYNSSNRSMVNNTNTAKSRAYNTNTAHESEDFYQDEETSPMMVSIILKSLFFGAIGATIICAFILFKHKPVKIAKNANEYVDKQTINITNAYDHFSRSTVNKTPINRNR